MAIRLNKEASWLYPASEPSRRWAFAPHTAHNSLVLDAALASEVSPWDTFLQCFLFMLLWSQAAVPRVPLC